MEILVHRKYKKDEYTISNMYIDGEWMCNVLEDTDRGLDDGMELWKIKNKKIPTRTAVPTGRYEIDMSTISPRFSQKAFYKQSCNGKVPRIKNVKGFEGVLIHCLTPDTEILTEYGWQNLESFKSNTPSKCYSYNTETKKAELVDIEGFVERPYDGDLYYCDGKRVCYEVTDEHRMYFGAYKRNGELDWRFAKVKDMVKSPHFLTSACKDGWEISEAQMMLYRLLMAVQADGYIINWSNTASQVRFHLVKERKINRVKYLVESLGGEYKEFVDCEGKTHICLDSSLSEIITELMNPYRYVKNYKELPIELLNLCSEDMKELVYEYLFWDGRRETHVSGKGSTISSTNENTINLLQTMCCLSGLRTNKRLERPKNGGHSKLWNLSFFENQEDVVPMPETFGTRRYNGQVWCLQNCNTTLFIRKNGRTMIIGNCGNDETHTEGCLLVGKNTQVGKVTQSQETFKKIYALMSEAHTNGETIYINIE